MFTGIIECVGKISGIKEKPFGRCFVLNLSDNLNNIRFGDSISVNGCCLTVEQTDKNRFQAFAGYETLKKTTLNDSRTGENVNIERALKVGDRLGGHWVTGHVDCVGSILSEKRIGDAVEKQIGIKEDYLSQVAPKGSIAVDGISLTVAEKHHFGISVALIPHTLANTTLPEKRPGTKVNLETDILAKYVESSFRGEGSVLSLDRLKAMGF